MRAKCCSAALGALHVSLFDTYHTVLSSPPAATSLWRGNPVHTTLPFYSNINTNRVEKSWALFSSCKQFTKIHQQNFQLMAWYHSSSKLICPILWVGTSFYMYCACLNLAHCSCFIQWIIVLHGRLPCGEWCSWISHEDSAINTCQ